MYHLRTKTSSHGNIEGAIWGYEEHGFEKQHCGLLFILCLDKPWVGNYFSWINDNMIISTQEVVAKTKKDLMTYFEYEDCGEMKEYVGNKVTRLQDWGHMIYLKHLLEPVKPQVNLSMILEIYNQGAGNLANNWSAGGSMRHVKVRQNFLHKLKAEGILLVK